MAYEPSLVPPRDIDTLRDFLVQELLQIAAAINGPQVDAITLTALTAEPSPLVDGMIVFADGTTWNPGSGRGVYERRSSSWVKL